MRMKIKAWASRTGISMSTKDRNITLKTFASQRGELHDLRAANRKLAQQVEAERRRTADVTEAVYQAARDAARGLDYDPVPAPKAQSSKQTAEVALVVVSDVQLGKRTADYDTVVCAKRMELYAQKIERLVEIQRSDHPVRAARVYMLGDMIEGELIFPSQPYLVDASLYKQVMLDGPRIYGEFLRRLLRIFESVTVHGVVGNHGCCPASTRAVTRRGLATWDAIEVGDEVMSVDDAGHTIWEPVLECVSYEHVGAMVRVQTRDTNFAVTPEHRVVGQSVESGQWREWRADALGPMFRLVMAGRGGEHDAPISDERIRLLAWCLTDSHRTPKHGYWHFYQREEKCARIGGLLSSIGLSFSTAVRQRNITEICGKRLKSCAPSVEYHVRADDSRLVSEWCPSRDSLPEWVWSLSERQVGVLIDEWVYTDGSHPKGNGVSIYLSRQQLREELQILLAANGYRATSTEYRPQHWRLNVVKTQVTHVASKKAASTEHYEGTAWCVRVPNGRFFAEDNGRLFLTGNSIGGYSRRMHNPTTNADRMLYSVLREVLSAEKRLRFVIPEAERERNWYAVDYPVGQDFGVLLFHGDQIRGGFAGFPFYGVAKKVWGWRSGAVREPFRYAVFGHFHTPTRMTLNDITVWANGTVESSNTYAQEELAASGRPTQLVLFAHPRVGVSAEYWVTLD